MLGQYQNQKHLSQQIVGLAQDGTPINNVGYDAYNDQI